MRNLQLPYSLNQTFRTAMWLIVLLGCSATLQAQTCQGLVNASLQSNCELVMTPASFNAPAGSTITIEVNSTNRANNTLGINDVGQSIKYTLTVPGSQPCWGDINLENKLFPVITCPSPAEMKCSESTEILSAITTLNPLTNATATDCFGALTVTHFDQVANLNCRGNALDFDDVDDAITVPGFSNLTAPFTFEAFVKPTTKTNFSTIISTKVAGSSAPGFFFSINDFGGSTGQLVFGTTANKVISTGSVTFGVWQHVAVTYDGTDVRMYINGLPEVTTGAVDLQPGASTTALIGGGVSGANDYKYVGAMDELRIWSTVRTATDIAAYSNRPLNGNETGLSSYYSFDQGIAEGDNSAPPINTLSDDRGSLNGTLSGFSLTGVNSNWVNDAFMSNKFSQIINRTFVATGRNGMSSSCTQEIKIERADTLNVTMPADYMESCSVNASTLPSVTGYPTYDPDGAGGIPAVDLIPGQTGGACMLLSTFSDIGLTKCGPDTLIKRTWRVINMCQDGTPNVMMMMDQLITITTPNPTIDPIAAITISADFGVAPAHGGCSSTASLPTATISGLCSGQVVQASNVTISIPGLGQTTNGGAIPSPGLPLGGPYTITYMATDDCGNIGTREVQVTVVDSIAPQCNTLDANVTLSEDGTAVVGFESFDRNSSDNCSANVWVSVRRLNGLCSTGALDDFGSTVEFCCADVPTGTEDEVMVEQLVCDKDPTNPLNYSNGIVATNSDGSPGATFTGNCSRCMAIATVKLPSERTFTCPSTARISCNTYDNSTLYGSPTVDFACVTGTYTRFKDAGSVDCMQDTSVLIRTHELMASDSITVLESCTQELRIGGGATVVVPSDTTISCNNFSCASPPTEIQTGGAPTVSGCFSGVAVFTPGTPTCSADGDSLVIIRTWTLTAPADLAACFNGQVFTQRIVAENCCVRPIVNFETPAGGTTASFEFDVTTPEANYSWSWFSGACGDDSSPQAATFDNQKSITGLTAGATYHVNFTQNNNAACPRCEAFITRSARIIGRVASEFGTPIQNVRVALESNQAARVIGEGSIMSEVMTDDLGDYAFENVDLPSLNRMTLVKDGDDRDNISTKDLLIMARHILGVKEISSPYAYIAADLTGNGKISTGDMLLMQKIVLGITSDMPNNTSWRFVKEDHVFDDMNTILDYEFPENFTFTGEETEEHLSNVNFIAVKVGDLAGAYGAELQGGNTTAKTLSLQTENQELRPGAIIEVPITVGDTRSLSGYQHAYKFDTDKIVFTGIDFGNELGLGDNNFGYKHLSDGFLTTSWFDTEDKNIEAGTVIYKLRFEVKEAAQLSDVLSISSEHTNAEAYFDEDNVGSVQFSFSESLGDKLMVTNVPNPFKESTQVRFMAPSTGHALIRVSDMSGREVYRSELTATKGDNQLVISKSDLQKVGMYILKIDLNGSSATQKIVVIE